MYLHISGYHFTQIPLLELEPLRQQLKAKAECLNLKGTILLGTEGINLFMAGSVADIRAYQVFLAEIPVCAPLVFKENKSVEAPFSRLLVRIKSEIIAMGKPDVRPEQKTAPYLAPETLKAWFDEKRDFVILDTRNDYEVAVGTFDQAVDLNIENFRQFPDAVAMLPETLKSKPIVTFCTGGIRCEKAAEWMQQQGFSEVYQLDGGILNYFAKVGGEHYHGECFVFDKRLTVDTQLAETQTNRCFAHREQEADCPYCHHLQQSRQQDSAPFQGGL